MKDLYSLIDSIDTLTDFQTSVISLIWKHLQYGSLPVKGYPNDLYLWSPTGTGKTLCFALPIMLYLRSQTIRGLTRALVIAPTENLVRQLAAVFQTLAKSCAKCRVLTADEALRENVSMNFDPCVIISTLGMLSQLFKSSINFDHLRFLVLDEADRLLSQVDDIQFLVEICRETPRNPAEWTLLPLQKIMASATLDLTRANTSLIKCYEPLLVKSNPDGSVNICLLYARIGQNDEPTVPPTVKEYAIECSSESIKPLILKELIEISKSEILPAIIFTDSKKDAHTLYAACEQMFSESQSASKSEDVSLYLCTSDSRPTKFPSNASLLELFICSDLLARGSDTRAIKTVFQYSVPKHLTSYVHRVGRTARMGQSGRAITLATSGKQLRRICSLRPGIEIIKISEDCSNHVRKAVQDSKSGIFQGNTL